MAVVWLLVALGLAPAVDATNFGSTTQTGSCNPWTDPCNSRSLAGNSIHTWQPIDLNGNVLASLRWSDANVFDPTVMTFGEVASGAPIDVYVYDNNWGDLSVTAWVYCPPYASSVTGSDPAKRCVGQEIHFNDYFWWRWAPGGVVNWTILASITTHEFGHTVGLAHRNADFSAICEPRYECAGHSGQFSPYLSPHDVQHITDTYS